MSQASENNRDSDALKRALYAVKDMRAKLDAVEQAKKEPIAIIGLGCRLPGGANDAETYWRLLHDGVDAVAEIPADRWDVDAHYDPDPDVPGKMHTRWGSFVNDIDKFDPKFFGIAPREAVSLDPQQRMLLEVSWEALENAGYAPDKLSGSQTGVFIGISTNDFAHYLQRGNGPASIDPYTGTGGAFCVAAGRISYLLGLHGPNFAVDTACSSSLVAVHLACQSLRTGKSQMALAGGVNLILIPEPSIYFTKMRAISPDGRCKTFDAAADGYGRGEGCGLIVLKRLSDALRDGDHVHALIRGTAINHDGRSSGLTVPNAQAQQAVIREALADAELDPLQVGYVDAHGTGTPLGDPIEMRALAAALCHGREKDGRLIVGSAKTNFGHLEAAAGIAGLLKVVLALQHREIPPHLHFKNPSPHIPWAELPIHVPTAATAWEAKERLAGVSSFGFSGTNAHVILQEWVEGREGDWVRGRVGESVSGSANERERETRERPLHLLALSAKSEKALLELAGRYARHLTANSSSSLADIAFTANTGRQHFSQRLAIVVDSTAQLCEKLAAFSSGRTASAIHTGSSDEATRPKIAFLFTGQGSQYAGMGRQLYETQPTFRKTLDQCDEILRPYLETPLLSVLFPETSEEWPLAPCPLLDQTAYTQPALFALEYALSELWRSWGIKPSVVMGHSVGEYVAACVAGMMSLEDGLKLIAARGRLMQALPQNGAMVAVFADEEKVKAALAPHKDEGSIAAVNGPQNVVISGEKSAVATIVQRLETQGIKSRPLHVSHAFHSPLMDPMLDEFERLASTITFKRSRIPLISNLTGQRFDFGFGIWDFGENDPSNSPSTIRTPQSYWRRHVREAVRFYDSMRTLHEQGYDLFLEIGPTPTLLGMASRCVPEGHGTWLPSLRANHDDWQQMLKSLATLYVHGVEVDWAGVDRDYPRRRVVLPSYPFQRERYWIEESRGLKAEGSGLILEPGVSTSHPLLGERLSLPLERETLFQKQISTRTLGFLNDHRVYGAAIFPATGYVELALAAAKESLGSGRHRIDEMIIQEALILGEEEARTLQVVLTRESDGQGLFQIFSSEPSGTDSSNSWRLHAQGKVGLDQHQGNPSSASNLEEVRSRCHGETSIEAYYENLRRSGMEYGPTFQGLEHLWGGEGESFAEVRLSGELSAGDYQIHPALLDACFQALGAALPQSEDSSETYLPVGIEAFRLHQTGMSHLWAHVRIRRPIAAGAETLTSDLTLFDEDGQIAAEIIGLHLRRAERAALQRAFAERRHDWLYQLEWKPVPLLESVAPSPKAVADRWLIFADRIGVAQALEQQLSGRGEHCVLVYPSESYEHPGEGRFSIDPANVSDFQRLLQETIGAHELQYRGIVHLWGVENATDAEMNTDVLNTAQAHICGSVLHLVQALAKVAGTGKPRLWLVTRQAQSITDEPAEIDLKGSSLWGLARTIAVEHPELRCTRVDLEETASDQPSTCSGQLVLDLLSDDSEDQIAYRGGKRYVARLEKFKGRRAKSEEQEASANALQLEISARGVLENLAYVSVPRRKPVAGEVEVQVCATGLNFRDVLNALGMYPGDAGPLGGECAGRIVAVGEGVGNVKVGDEVIALGPACFSTYVTTKADWVAAKPAHLSFEEAATIPIAFLTAYYGLHHLAKIRSNERVLVHSAAGGVGVAAVQLAQRAGAEIFGTASPGKWEFLKSLGVQHILSSRNLEFSAQIMPATAGKGVDLVLNSLSDEFIPRSLSVLSEGGRFLEIGKRGIWNKEKVSEFRSDISYWSYDLGEVMLNDPALIQTMYAELLVGFNDGTLKPLPLKVFSSQEVISAFRYMAGAKHVGKVVVKQSEAWSEEREAKSEERGAKGEGRKVKGAHLTPRPSPFTPRYTSIQADATYLITGGLGALGLRVAEWLVEKGARHLILVGRSEPSDSAREAIKKIEQAGAQITIAPGDVSRAEDVDRVLALQRPAGLSLKGIIHAAGVLDDGVLVQQNWERFERVMSPKVAGAWNLHLLTKDLDLDFFVLFSSTSSLLGSGGQGNYAAANAFMDALAHYRRRQGLPAISINWGPWADVGMAAGLNTRDQARMQKQGMGVIVAEQGLQLLDSLLNYPAAQVGVIPVNWRTFMQQSTKANVPPVLRAIAAKTDVKSNQPDKGAKSANELVNRLQKAPAEERLPLLISHVREIAARVLGLNSPEAIGLRQPLSELGMDSLMAVEMRNALGNGVGQQLPATLLFDYPTLQALVDFLSKQVLALEAHPISKPKAAKPVPGNEPIAIIGIGCRFPGGANGPEAFWQLLHEGREGVVEIPGDRWNVDEYYDPNPDAPGKMYVRSGAFLQEVDKFDPKFFGIAPREAVRMDPQQRLLLEVTWEALEHAGIIPEKLAGSNTGVFIGISGTDYLQLMLKHLGTSDIDAYAGTGNALSVASGRLSYTLGLQGPSLAVDTACSSSLVSVHLACQSLHNGESNLALAGGVNLMLVPEATINFSKARMLAADGRCKTFDDSADGYVRGEGCGMIVLKRLSNAITNGDNILAVIRGSAVNQDGRSNGLTAPNGPAQEEVIRHALENSGITPAQVSYVEAHGTGTSLGDPIEVRALGNVMSAGRSKDNPLVIGSVKTNFGHLEAAAGIAGLIKVVLALQHEEIPSHLHFKKLNRNISLEEIPAMIPVRGMPWLPDGSPRIAGISSFGFSGTNAHVVLQSWEKGKEDERESGRAGKEERGREDEWTSGRVEKREAAVAPERRTHLLCISTKSETSLRALAAGYVRLLQDQAAGSVPDICYSAFTTRSHFDYRLAVVGESHEQMQERLAAFARGEVPGGVVKGKASEASAPKIVFLFTGQGSQYVGMGRQLYATQPTFRKALDRCDELLRPHLEQPLLSVLFTDTASSSTTPSALRPLLDQTAYTQPALFAIEYALAELWQSWGIRPAVVMGHSVGEYVAACVAGMMSLEDGLKLIAARGRLMQALPQNGAMVAVFADEARVVQAVASCQETVAIAALNGPHNIVISGERNSVAGIVKQLEAEGIKSKPLVVSHAFHSPLMEPMLGEFERIAGEIEFHQPTVPLISNLTGQRFDFGLWISDFGEKDSSNPQSTIRDPKSSVPQSPIPNPQSYWRRHVREAVRFSASIQTLREQGCTIFLEIGPSPVLLGMASRCVPENYGVWVPSLRQGQDDWQQMLKGLGALYVNGANLDWPNFESGHVRRRVPLPTYAFERERHWIAEGGGRRVGQSSELRSPTNHPLLGDRLHLSLQDVHVFEVQLTLRELRYLDDHRIYGAAVLPATAYLEMAISAAYEALGKGLYAIEDLMIQEPLILKEDRNRTLQLVLHREAKRAVFQLFSLNDQQTDSQTMWRLHASGKINSQAASAPPPLALVELRDRCAYSLPVETYYSDLHAQGISYGPNFQGIKQMWHGEGQALGEIHLPEEIRSQADSYHLHPVLLDACFQILGAAYSQNGAASRRQTYLPLSVERFRLYASGKAQLWGHAQLQLSADALPETMRADIRLLDETGAWVAEIQGLHLKRADRDMLQRAVAERLDEWLYRLTWEPKPLVRQAASTRLPASETHTLILADRAGMGESLAKALHAAGEKCVLAYADHAHCKMADELHALNPLQPEEFQQLLHETLRASEAKHRRIVHLRSLDDEPTDNAPLTAARACASVLHLVQALGKLSGVEKPRLYLITAGAQSVASEGSPLSLTQSTLWGLGRTIAAEHPELRCVRIDLESAGGNRQPHSLSSSLADSATGVLANEMLADDAEDQVAYREGRRFVARLARIEEGRAQSEAVDPSTTALQLQITARGVLDQLAYKPVSRRQPGRGEVEIQVHATGLNFRDVLIVLGMYPGESTPIGFECAGTIVAVGEGVEGFKPGDEVIALGSGCFSTYTTTRADWIARRPVNMSFEEAATIPLVFLTAYYGLHHLAGIKAGDCVLIHSAAGGVGVAAVQLAQRAGAEVFGTASTGKWDFLKSLGVPHIMNSRTLEFAEQVMQATDGRGVNLVLNSLADEFIPKSLSILAENGRFLELGKRGIWSPQQVAEFRRDIAYWAYDLGEVMVNDPALIRQMYEDLLAGFEEGSLKPLPLKAFSHEETVAAFRYMAQAKHVGKIVVVERKAKSVKREASSAVRSDATYLITGGLGALGVRVAEWLVEKGARHLVLVGRSAPSESARVAINRMEEAGTQVLIARGDVSRADDVKNLLSPFAGGPDSQLPLPPLKGVIHAAGILDDGVLLQQSLERFEKVMAPKVLGAWNLHEATKNQNLDFFILFSSTASLLGSAGQGNYAAANAFMDALAHYRRAQGLPALSINWGPWSEAGMAASLSAKDQQRMASQGLSLIAPQQGMQILEQLLSTRQPQVGVLPVNWRRFMQQFKAGNEPPVLNAFAQLAEVKPDKTGKTEKPANELVRQLQTAGAEQRRELLANHVRGTAARVLALNSPDDLGWQQPLSELGMDSLMAVELRNALANSVGHELPATLLFDYPNLKALVDYLSREVLALETLQAPAVSSKPVPRDEPIAIIGIGCRFPGEANDPEAFWQLLREGRDAIIEVPPDRWNIDEYYDPDPEAAGKMYVRAGGFLKEVDKFDPRFFGISPREAVSMDPQQRLLLEVAWEALENAGEVPDRLMGSRTGVFIGISTNDYGQIRARISDTNSIDVYSGTGNALSVASGRLSYTLGLQGPNIAIDTACSSSLVAVHLACQSLRNGESHLALAGGVNLILSPETTISFCRGRMLAVDGRCKTFDARADGYVRGEGCGMIVLKRLSDAIAGGDNILAVIRGSAINQDGRSNGLTAPNGPAQEDVIRCALNAAGIEPAQVDYVEAHGTGTSLGDPIEVHALKNVMSKDRPAERPLLLGSVKTNFGHLEAAAGMAGLIKVVLALQHGEIPPHLHFKQLNPNISLDGFPAVIPTSAQAWPRNGEPRIAGVSSFGFSGTNAHVVLTEWETVDSPTLPLSLSPSLEKERPAHLLCISAKTEVALRDVAAKNERHLAEHASTSLGDICYSAITIRSHFEHRLAVVGESHEQMRQRLASFAVGNPEAGVVSGKAQEANRPRMAFLFTGGGSQYVGMGKQLFETQPVFRNTLLKCDEILRPCLEQPLLSVLYPESTDHSSLNTVHWLDRIDYTLPALFACEYALAELWKSWGITPSVVMGHSAGEYVAACIAGVFSLEDGLKLSAARGRLMNSLPENGAMVALSLDGEKVAAAIAAYRDRVAIGAINGPQNVMISGEKQAIEEILRQFRSSDIKIKTLAVSHASHSPLMEPILDEFERVASEITYHLPQIPFVSNLTGQLFDFGFRISDFGSQSTSNESSNPQSAIPNPQSYWRRHLRNTVRFADSLQTLRAQGYEVFLEIGPHPTLLGMGIQCVPEGWGLWAPSLRRNQNDWQQLLTSLGMLYTRGVEIDWKGYERDYPRRRVMLPTYPFRKERYWVAERRAQSAERKARASGLHPLLGQRLRSPLIKEVVFETQLSIEDLPMLQDHCVYGAVVFPATAYMEMAVAAADKGLHGGPYWIEEMAMPEALVFSKDEARTIQVIFSSENGATSFRIFSAAANDDEEERKWILHAEGLVRAAQADGKNGAATPEQVNVEALRARCQNEVQVAEYYQTLRETGLEYGSSFQGIAQLWRGEGEALGRIHLPETIQVEAEAYHIHPALLDSSFQTLGVAYSTNGHQTDGKVTYLPHRLKSFRVYGRAGSALWSHVQIQTGEDSEQAGLRGHIRLFDESGKLVAEVEGLYLKRAGRELMRRVTQERLNDWLYEIAWKPKPRSSQIGRALPADFLMAPEEIATQVHPHVAQMKARLGLEIYDELVPQLNALCAVYVQQAFAQLGWKLQLGQRVSAPTLAQQLGVIEQHRRLLRRMLEMLQEDGVLKQGGTEWEVCQAPTLADPQKLSDELLSRFPACSAELALTSRCGRHLAEVLRGEMNPLQLLFPEGAVSDTEKLYQEAPASQMFNTLVQEAISAALEKLPEGRTLRILEIGAGTGGTTTFVLPTLPAERTEYVFTDLSPMFTAKAEQKFRGYSFMRYQVLDIEREPQAQGFAPHQFDVILAANVLHATSDLRQTVRNILQLLAPEGLFVLLEGTARQRWLDLSFGMLEGWWRFSDLDLRPSYPLLPQRQWLELFKEMGFTAAAAIPRPEESGKEWAQAVMLAAGPRVEMAETEAHGHWLIFADRGGVAQQLAASLQAAGESCSLVSVGEAYKAFAKNHWQINPAKREDFKRLLREALLPAHQLPCRGVIYLWALDLQTSEEATTAHLDEAQKLGCGGVLLLVQALANAGLPQSPRLWLVTRSAQAAGADSAPLAVAQAPLWGLGKVIALEHADLHCVRIDLDPVDEKAGVHALFEELWSKEAEDQVAFRRNERYVARMVRSAKSGERRAEIGKRFTLHASCSTSGPVQLQIPARGMLDNLVLQPGAHRQPGPGEVEIRVHATGLNFRDVLNALGMYPGDPGPLGGECVGTIVAIGEGVEGLQVGDEVVALAAGCFSTFVTTKAQFVVAKPSHLSFEQAATIPIAFLTAYYGLHHLARMKAGDRVLIHAAAGGVGLAAVQLAQRAGAEIFATASPAKWDHLKSLGVQHVMNSRTLDFAGQVMQATNGASVNIVLNSLADEFIPKSMSVLAPNGRFLEIGKRGIWSNEQIAAFRPDVSYWVCDLVQVMLTEPALIHAMFRELMAGFIEGSLAPLPLRTFPLDDAINAFRYMAQAKHIGKVVITQRAEGEGREAKGEERDAVSAIRPKGAFANPQSTILITGGLGALGLVVAEWMVEQGARHLVLMGRRAPSDEAAETIRRLEKTGAQIIVAQGDVAQREDVARALATITALSMPPLRGIIQSAGVLDDGVLLQQDTKRFARVMAPKVNGAWNLHTLTREMPLDFFVLFSSVASFLGSPGQGNHAAANAFLDALAHHRRALGLPALSINWGVWAEIGAAAKRQVGARVSTQGLESFSPEQGLQALELLLRQASPQVGVLPINWYKCMQQFPTGGEPPFFAEMVDEAKAGAKDEHGAQRETERPNLLRQLETAPAGERLDILTNHLQALAAKVLGVSSTDSLDLQRPLHELGLDSLMAVELRNAIGNAVGRSLPATLLFDYPTIEKLVGYLAKEVLALAPSAKPADGEYEQEDERAEMVAEIKQLSEEEVEASIAEELEKLINIE